MAAIPDKKECVNFQNREEKNLWERILHSVIVGGRHTGNITKTVDVLFQNICQRSERL